VAASFGSSRSAGTVRTELQADDEPEPAPVGKGTTEAREASNVEADEDRFCDSHASEGGSKQATSLARIAAEDGSMRHRR
jgi:hypothetical protein